RRRGQPSHSSCKCRGVLGRESSLGPWGDRRRAEAEPAVPLPPEPFEEPGRGLLHPPILGQPARELLRSLLRLELIELGRLLREQRTRLQFEQRRDEDEELAAGLEVELVSFRQAFQEGEHDAGHVDLARLEGLLEQQRQEKVEGALERVEIELELPDLARGHPLRLAGLPDAYLRGPNEGTA